MSINKQWLFSACSYCGDEMGLEYGCNDMIKFK